MSFYTKWLIYLKSSLNLTLNISIYRNDLTQILLCNASETSKQYTATHLYELTRKYLIYTSFKYLKHSKQSVLTPGNTGTSGTDERQSVFQSMCTLISTSILTGDFKHSYVSLIVSKEYYQLFVKQSHQFLHACVSQLEALNLKDVQNYKTFVCVLNVITMLTDHKLWKCYKIENSMDS